jgi:hypothetical protein
MTDPSQRSSRIALAAGAAAALALAIGGYVIGRATATPPQPAPAAVPEPPAPRLPALTPPLGRSDLLAAAAAAADAYAMGRADTPENADLVGRRFEIRIPFGCYGASPEDSAASLRWNYDADDKALRISATPEVWTDLPWVRALAGEQAEAVEGFWIPRPWSSAESCPTPEARMALPPILPTPQQTVGLAQLFETGGSRVHRRDGKPYRTVEKVEPEELQATEGFQLVLSGRVGAFPNGQPVGCHSAGAELQPVCLVAVEFERVAIENPLSRDQLAAWNL